MKNQQGFTLIELLVVVLIIGILTAVALPQYTTAVEKSRAAEALTLMSAMTGSIERYRLQKDAWPERFTQLDVEIPETLDLEGNPANGGTNFIMGFMANEDGTCVVTATRRLSDPNQKYLLKTTITEERNGTFSTVRECTRSNGNAITPADNSDAAKFCNAVTSGHPDRF